MNISQIGSNKGIQKNLNKPKAETSEKQTEQGVQQFSQKTSSACMSYGMARISFGGVQKVSNKPQTTQDGSKTVNLFYFSDTHGELSGLTKLASAKEACEAYCGGKTKFSGFGGRGFCCRKQNPDI